jgi:hypothetical protein
MLVQVATQSAAPITLKTMNFAQWIPLMPAMVPLAWRRPSMKRATMMIQPPWRSKKPVALD